MSDREAHAILTLALIVGIGIWFVTFGTGFGALASMGFSLLSAVVTAVFIIWLGTPRG